MCTICSNKIYDVRYYMCSKADMLANEIECTGCNQEMENCQCQMIVYMFHETNRKLIELELLERLVGNVLTSLIHIRIQNHVTQMCDKTFDVSQLVPLENVRQCIFIITYRIR